jgi:DNA-binding CsgD family transcriptional regulator
MILIFIIHVLYNFNVVMPNFLNYESLLNSIIKLQSHLYLKTSGQSKPFDTAYLNTFSTNENAVKILFDHEQFKIVYISDNVESFSGYMVKDFYNVNMLFVLKIFSISHISFIYDWLNWAVQVQAKLGDLTNSQQTICGVKLKHKSGRDMFLMLRYSPVETAENGAIKLAAISVDDATHLVKGDFYWGRLERTKRTETNIHHFLSTDKKDIAHDIISERELVVLRLLAEGKESKEIGELLFISHHTVDNHRRSMIAKIGVKDTTGLIQICKMAGII